MAAVMLLETQDLCRNFGGLKAVSDVSFALASGEVRAIIGPNGAGKTTFVSLIAGRIAPSSGRIRFEGADITGVPAHARVRRGIAYTFQITSIYAKLTVLENVALATQGRRTGASGRPPQHYLDLVGLSDRPQQIAGTLAYGHQRLLEIAMGMALEPRLLILDEPTQGLSDSDIANFIGLVKAIAEHATVLLIEHNMQVVMETASRITVMDQGRILAEGSPAEIRGNADVQRAYLGTT
jgi:branched-chain amino acid transport system ATP-binding protein